MSDPFSIASGAVGIISLGFTIAQGLFQVADGIGSAGQEVRVYAEEINAFSKLLNRVKNELENSTDVSIDLQSLVKDVMDVCERVLAPLDCLQNTLKPLLEHFRSSPGKFRQLGLRLRWVFSTRDKLLFYREVLKGQHRILDTTLEVMILQTTKDRSPQNVFIMQLSLENSMTAVGQFYRAGRQAGSRIPFEESSPERLATTGGVQIVHDTSDDSLGSLDPIAHESISENNVVLVRMSAPSTEFGEELSDQEVQAIDMQIERDLSSESPESAQDLWLDMGSMQRKVLRLASQALRSAQESKKEDQSSNPQQRSGPDFEMPVLFVSTPKNTHGPVLEREVIDLNGTDESLAATGSNLRIKRALEDQLYTQGGGTTNDEGSTWVNLLNELRRMEHDSMAWEEEEYRKTVERTEEPNPDGVPAAWLEHTMAVGLQKQRRSWDTMPSNVKKPYAMTTISHLIEMTAMLGLYWKVFDRVEDKYRAEDNGCTLTGTAVPDLGLVFNFQITGNRNFRGTRLIPTDDVRNLCFGVVPTIYRNLEKTERSGYPANKLLGLSVLQVGSRQEIAETLGRIGCNTVTCNLFLDETKNFTHLFPVVFEILGMLSCTFHIPNTMFTYVPDPTPVRWEKNNVNFELLLESYLSHLTADVQWKSWDSVIRELETHGWRILNHTRESYREGKIGLLEALHEAINDCDQILTSKNDTPFPQMTQMVIQEVLRLLNRDDDRASDTDPDQDTNELPATYRGRASVGDIHEASPEERQDKFMAFYFSNVRPNVSARANRATDRRSAASATHAGGILSHVGLSRAKRGADTLGPPSPRLSTTSRRLRSRERRDQSPPREEMHRNEVWCTLIFRMVCWLMLHDFDRSDVQVSKSEVLGSRMPVYIS